jgi:hypothetical protein
VLGVAYSPLGRCPCRAASRPADGLRRQSRARRYVEYGARIGIPTRPPPTYARCRPHPRFENIGTAACTA